MEKMLYTSAQPSVTVTLLPDGKRDVTVLTNEQEVPVLDADGAEAGTAYEYDGNQFRTVYELTAEQVATDLETYLHYTAAGEPTLEQLAHDNELIDNYTVQLIEEGIL